MLVSHGVMLRATRPIQVVKVVFLLPADLKKKNRTLKSMLTRNHHSTYDPSISRHKIPEPEIDYDFSLMSSGVLVKPSRTPSSPVFKVSALSSIMATTSWSSLVAGQ
jgi:hypothetical protein